MSSSGRSIAAKGIGKALVQALLDHPDLRSVSTWMLNTSDAHNLYARFGFKPVTDGNEMRLDRQPPSQL